MNWYVKVGQKPILLNMSYTISNSSVCKMAKAVKITTTRVNTQPKNCTDSYTQNQLSYVCKTFETLFSEGRKKERLRYKGGQSGSVQFLFYYRKKASYCLTKGSVEALN